MNKCFEKCKLEFYKKLQKKLQLVIVGDLNLYDWNSEIRDKIESLEISFENKLNEPEKKELHWYQVRHTYRRKGTNTPAFTWDTQVGVSEQKDVFNWRSLKKSNKPLHKQDLSYETRWCLNNGTLVTEIRCYLGYFSV
jgi:predicted MPP superfamily phosphohydrolase